MKIIVKVISRKKLPKTQISSSLCITSTYKHCSYEPNNYLACLFTKEMKKTCEFDLTEKKHKRTSVSFIQNESAVVL